MPFSFALYTKELLRPWKLCTLAIGIALLIAGSFYYQAPDWDIPIILIMGSLQSLRDDVLGLIKRA
jgi:hypothetical protein